MSMDQIVLQKLHNEFDSLMERGDENAARQFLVDHFSEFPEDAQAELISVLFEEALAREKESVGALAGAEQELASDLDTLSKAQRILEDKLKVKDLMGEKE